MAWFLVLFGFANLATLRERSHVDLGMHGPEKLGKNNEIVSLYFLGNSISIGVVDALDVMYLSCVCQ